MLTDEEIHAEDSKDSEKEGQSHAYVEEFRHGSNEGFDQCFHGVKRVNRAKRSEHSCRAKGLEALLVREGSQADQTYEDNSEVNPVPWVLQIRVSMPTETHSDNLNDALKRKYHCKCQVSLLKCCIPAGLVGRIVIFIVLFRCEQDRVHYDAESDESVEPFVDHQVDAEFPKSYIR